MVPPLGKVNEHNGGFPDFWLEDWEKQAIIAFHWEYPWRVSSPGLHDAGQGHSGGESTSVWRVLSVAGLLRRWNDKPPRGFGVCAPLRRMSIGM